MNQEKFLIKKNILFSNIFKLNEGIDEKEEKDSNEYSEHTEDNIIYKINNNFKISNKLKEEYLSKAITILIYSGTKKDSIIYNVNQKLSELIKYLTKYNYISKDDKEKNNFKILYGLEELNMDDNRTILEIITENKNNKNFGLENQIKVIVKTKEKEFLKNKKIEKISVSLENIPSFMDLSEQINIFMNKYNKKDIKYDIIYKNNCCNIIFLSPEISFSFVTFMTNLKFSNKYYRKLRIKIKYINYLIKNNNYLSQKSLIQSNNINSLNTINNTLRKSVSTKGNIISLKNNIFNKRKTNKNISSYDHILANTEPNEINNYFNNKINSINESIPYDYEKVVNKLEKEKSKKQWITYKGFFNEENKKSFNRFINPYNNKISLLSIANNNKRKILLNVNNL